MMIDAHEDDINTKELADFATGARRVILCANSLSGIPDSWLADRAAAKALLAWNILDRHESCLWDDENYNGTTVPSVGVVVNAALRTRSRGADFGELNQLIDSFNDA